MRDERVEKLLRELDLHRYSENFDQQEVTYEDLSLLNEDDLVQLGVMTLGPRRRLLQALGKDVEAMRPVPKLGVVDHQGAPAEQTYRTGTAPSARVSNAFERVDNDKDGLIDVDEFITAVLNMLPMASAEAAASTFSAFDEDGSGQLDLEEFIVAYNMVRQDLARPKSIPPVPEDLTPNLTTGKYFVGKKGAGRFRTVAAAASDDEKPMGSMTCDLFEDGLFVYQYEACHDDMPDGVEVLNFFLEDLFGKRDLEEAAPIPAATGVAGRAKAPPSARSNAGSGSGISGAAGSASGEASTRAGSVAASKAGSRPAGSAAGSAAASRAGSAAGSAGGSRVGSVAGSVVASEQQSRPASNTSTKSKNSQQYVETKCARPASNPATPEPAPYQHHIDGSIAASAHSSRAVSKASTRGQVVSPSGSRAASKASVRAPGAPRVSVGFKMKQIEKILHQGRIRSMAQLRSKSKRELDELGLALGPRAKISAAVESWRPPKYNDESFVMRGRWQAKEVGPVVQVRFRGEEEELAAYDNVRVPSQADFTLDASFLPSGSCRALNGNMPTANGLQRAFLSYLTDPREEEEVGWVRVKKETITNMIGSRLSALASDADWLLGEYAVQSNELVKSGGCYVDGPQVKRSQDKMQQLKSTIDQCVAVFEDYYGSVR